MGDDVARVGEHRLDDAGGRVLRRREHRRHARVAGDHRIEVALVGDRPAQVVRLCPLARLEVPRDHPRREDDRDADAVVGELDAQGLCEAPDRELAGLVRGEPAGGIEHRRRGRERQARPLRSSEQRDEAARDSRRTGDVDVEHPPPLVLGERLDRPEELHPDVGHHEVGHTEPIVDGGGRRVDAGGIPDVDAHRDRVHAVRLGEARGLGRGAVAVEVEQCDVHPERGASLGQGEAEPRCGPRDHGGGHQLSSGTTKSVWSRVSLEDLMRQPSAPFS